MGIRVCPCKGCTVETGRSPTCHSTCKRYIEWRQELDKFNATLRKQKELEEATWKFREPYC